MKKISTMFITQRLNHEYQSSFLRSIAHSIDTTYRNEFPGEIARKSVLQFAGSLEIIPTKGIGKVDAFAN
ncbi:MAG: hypothetical protein HOO86_11810 [Bacteroidales bacterium]|nr:hypothetical protein [Bacteroidales bacterium]